jgi:DNA-binding Xre family transcriptional regulator
VTDNQINRLITEIMETKDLNRLKVVLAEKKRTNKWLAEQLGKDPATVSKWCTNSAQPNLENLMEIAKGLEVNVNELLRM